MTTSMFDAPAKRSGAFGLIGLMTCGALSAIVACGSSDGPSQPPAAGPPESPSGSGSSGSGSGTPSAAAPANDGGFIPGSDAQSAGGDAGMDDEGAAACAKGQVQPSEVVMLGDSYMDAPWGDVGPTLMAVAGATYRPYYIGGASLNGGSGQFNIPYQFLDMAVPDNPDIKVIIMDGGGNDLLLDNRQCLTTPVMGDTSCHTIIQGVVAKAQQLLPEASSYGVKSIVYLFYPHINANTIYSGADSNDWLDYAYPLAARVCCGASSPDAGGPGAGEFDAGAPDAREPDLTCHGSAAPGLDCTFVDTRPEFVGHTDPNDPSQYWLDGFGIHPNKQGAQVIAQKMWAQMQKYCIAQ
jgi:hypothetical protein